MNSMNTKLLILSILLISLFLLFGCTQNEITEDNNTQTGFDEINLVEYEGKVEIVMSKNEYLFGETIEFRLYNGTDRIIWYWENPSGCNYGSFSVLDPLKQNFTPSIRQLGDCVLESKKHFIPSGEFHEFSIEWNFNSFSDWGMLQVPIGENTIHMYYYDDLNAYCCPKFSLKSFTVLGSEVNPVCSEDPYYCRTNEDCVCSETGAFIGNKRYFEYCVDKAINDDQFCTGQSKKQAVCFENQCVNDYPKENWEFEDCKKIPFKNDRPLCQKELAFMKLETEKNEGFCDLLEDFPEFTKTDCRDQFYILKATETGDYSWCEKIVDPLIRQQCKPVMVSLEKEEYFFGESIGFRLCAGLEKDIWHVRDLDDCGSGPFYVIGVDNDYFYPVFGVACAMAHYDVELIKADECKNFSLDWDLISFTEEDEWQISQGEYRIQMEYYEDLNEVHLAVLDYNYDRLRELGVPDDDSYFWEALSNRRDVFSESFRIIEQDEEIGREPVLPLNDGNYYGELDGNVLLSVLRNGEHVFLDLVTEEIYNCHNFEFNSHVEMQRNVITVEIINVFLPEGIGAGAEGPARSSIDLGEVEGSYELIIKHNDKEDEYALEVTGEDVRIDSVFASFTSIQP